jgi:hypothetical protein
VATVYLSHAAPEGRATDVNDEVVDVDSGVILADASTAHRTRALLAAGGRCRLCAGVAHHPERVGLSRDPKSAPRSRDKSRESLRIVTHQSSCVSHPTGTGIGQRHAAPTMHACPDEPRSFG